MDLLLDEIRSIKEVAFDFRGSDKDRKRKARGISIDSRAIRPDEIYVAIRGENHDGHDFVGQAFEKRAAAAVVAANWWRNHGGSFSGKPVFVVFDTLAALQKLSNHHLSKFSVPVLALTGTNGKTTTKEMVAAVLSKSGSVCKTQGNLNNHIGVPLTIFNLNKNHKYLVTEMGANHFGEIKALCEIAEPGYGLITNIGHGHVESFKSLDGVAQAKMELFDYLASSGTAFVNLDDPLISKHLPKLKTRIDYGFRDEARVFGEVLEPGEDGHGRMRVQKETISIPLAGEHNLSNALAAVAVGLEFGIPISDMRAALETVQVPGKRVQIHRVGGTLVIDDSYNANPESTLAALKLLNGTPAKGRRIFVFGDMLELGDLARMEHAKIGEALPIHDVDVLFAFGPQSAHAVEAARKANPKMTAEHFEAKAELISRLQDTVRQDDILLVKGSRGMRMEEVLEGMFPSDLDA
jgi:UDP-N-acetylmuramoyl-tripeptide--D-alanyl-D-alanine ligase